MNNTEYYDLPLYSRDDLFSVEHYNNGMRALDEAMHSMHEEKVAVSPITEDMLGLEIPFNVVAVPDVTTVEEALYNVIEEKGYHFFTLNYYGTRLTDEPAECSNQFQIIVRRFADVVTVNEETGDRYTISRELYGISIVDLENDGATWTATYNYGVRDLSEWKRFDDLNEQKKNLLPVIFSDIVTGGDPELLVYMIDKCATYQHYSFLYRETSVEEGISDIIWKVNVFMYEESTITGNVYQVTKNRLSSPYTIQTNDFNLMEQGFTNLEWITLYPVSSETGTFSQWALEEIDMTDATDVTLSPYTHYKINNIGELLNISLAPPMNGIVPWYKFEITFGTELPVVSIGENITWIKSSSAMETTETTYLITIEDHYGRAEEV